MSAHPKIDAVGDFASGFGVRTASPFDVPLIAALHVDSFAGVNAGQVWNETVVAEVLAMPGAYGLLAIPGEDLLVAKNTGPAGFLLGCSRASSGADSAEILSIGTARAWRRRGVARALLGAALRRAEAAGIPRLFLEVAEDNTAARDLYAGAGFARIARSPAYYRCPDGPAVAALVLACDLV